MEMSEQERAVPARPSARTGEAMTTHTPVDVEVLSLSECANEECDHEDGCPTFVRAVCLECNTERQGTDDVTEWEGPVTVCAVLESTEQEKP